MAYNVGMGEPKYTVALSFSGHDRPYISAVAAELDRLGISTFFDESQEIELWGKDLGDVLMNTYLNDSTVVVMFISSSYAERDWPNHERRAAFARALTERREYVLPVRFDDTPLEGLLPTIKTLDANAMTPEECAGKILAKIKSLFGDTGELRLGLGWVRKASKSESGQLQLRVKNESGEPVADVIVAAVARNTTYVRGHTDSSGIAKLSLPDAHSTTVLIAHPDFTGALIRDHNPQQGLDVTLRREDRAGSTIFFGGSGHLPGLTGRLNPIRDTSNRLYIYASNIAVEGGAPQPVSFDLGRPLSMEDSNGKRLLVTIVEIIGDATLTNYRN